MRKFVALVSKCEKNMNVPLLDKIKILREQLPIGLNGAKKLLEQTNGNLSEAGELFKQQAFEIISQKLEFEISPLHIRQSLHDNSYDIEVTLTSLFNSHYTATERVLLHNKDKSKVLYRIANFIEEENNLKRNFWLNLDDIKGLNPSQKCIVTIHEWMEMESWEGFDYAICCYDWTKATCEEMRIHLQLHELTKSLEDAMTIAQEHYSTKRDILDRPDIELQYNIYTENEDLLIDGLYNLIRNNLNEFPK